MNVIQFSLILLAFIFALFAAINTASHWNLIGAALASYFLSLLITVGRGLLVLAICFVALTGCKNPPTPAEAQAYAEAGHTLVHGALIDAKDASSVYRNIEQP